MSNMTPYIISCLVGCLIGILYALIKNYLEEQDD
jgi:hypothetical protein